MVLSTRLRQLRELRGLSQGDVEKATGLMRCYTSRVENGHTVPSLETLEKYAAAFGVPLYQLFYEGETPPPLSKLALSKAFGDSTEGADKREPQARFLLRLRKALAKIAEPDRGIFLALAQKLASAKR